MSDRRARCYIKAISRLYYTEQFANRARVSIDGMKYRSGF